MSIESNKHSGHPSNRTNDESITKASDLVQYDRRNTICETAEEIQISDCSHHITSL
jgi:hypothetical protein